MAHLAAWPGLALAIQMQVDAGQRQDGGLTTAEREELNELRRENRGLREDVEILTRATAFFVTDTR